MNLRDNFGAVIFFFLVLFLRYRVAINFRLMGLVARLFCALPFRLCCCFFSLYIYFICFSFSIQLNSMGCGFFNDESQNFFVKFETHRKWKEMTVKYDLKRICTLFMWCFCNSVWFRHIYGWAMNRYENTCFRFIAMMCICQFNAWNCFVCSQFLVR